MRDCLEHFAVQHSLRTMCDTPSSKFTKLYVDDGVAPILDNPITYKCSMNKGKILYHLSTLSYLTCFFATLIFVLIKFVNLKYLANKFYTTYIYVVYFISKARSCVLCTVLKYNKY